MPDSIEDFINQYSKNEPFDMDSFISKYSSPQPIEQKAITAAATAPPEHTGIMEKITDFLSRDLYATTKFLDSYAWEGKNTFLESLKLAGAEFLNPESKMTYSDVIKKYAPEFAEAHPIATGALGMVGDTLLSPVNYLTFGYGSNVKRLEETGELLSKAGEAALGNLIKAGMERPAAEQAISQAIASGTKEYLAKGKIFSIPLVPQGTGEAIAKAVKIPELMETKFGKWMAQNPMTRFLTAIPRDLGLGYKEVRARRLFFENPINESERVMAEKLKEIFGKVSKEDSELLERIPQDIFDKTTRYYDEQYKQAYKELRLSNPQFKPSRVKATAKDIAEQATRERGQDFIDDVFKQYNFEGEKHKKLFDIYTRMKASYQDIGQGLRERGLIDDLVENYHPLYFDLMADTKSFKDYLNKIRHPYLPAGESRQFRTFEEARAYAQKEGIDLETNAVKLYTLRALEARRRVAFDDYLKQIQGLGYDLKKLPKKLADDIAYMGDGLYGKGLSEGARAGLRAYDYMTNMFRGFATVIRPAFAVKQAFSNAIQSYMESGLKSLLAWDPRSRIDAFHVMAHLSGLGDKEKYLASKIVTNLGENISGERLLKELADQGVIKGSHIGDYNSGRLGERIINEFKSNQWVVNKFGEEYEGLGKFARGLAKWTSWPSTVEDFARVNLYINARKQGHSAYEAARRVTDALFDYGNGISQIERRWVRRVVPFFTFERFAIPLIAKTLATNPGRVANIMKTSKDFMATWNALEGGQKLTYSQRQVLDPFLLDQPFTGFDQDKQAIFKVINNFNPIDIMSMIEPDQKGEVDIEKTMMNASLRQLAPLIKMPFELVLNRNLFTDQAIYGPEAKKAIGNVKPEQVLGNIAGMIGASSPYGIGAALLGKVAGEASPDMIKDEFKNLVGWEEGKDPAGKPTVFINPFLTYVLTSQFPALTQAIRLDRYDTPFQKWLDLIGGVPTTKRSFNVSSRAYLGKQQEEFKTLQYAMLKAYRDGRLDRAEEIHKELEEFIADMQRQNQFLNFNELK